jgi:hypothetical protein
LRLGEADASINFCIFARTLFSDFAEYEGGYKNADNRSDVKLKDAAEGKLYYPQIKHCRVQSGRNICREKIPYRPRWRYHANKFTQERTQQGAHDYYCDEQKPILSHLSFLL